MKYPDKTKYILNSNVWKAKFVQQSALEVPCLIPENEYVAFTIKTRFCQRISWRSTASSFFLFFTKHYKMNFTPLKSY